MFRASLPINCGLSSFSMQLTIEAHEPDDPTAAFASPKPCSPLSVVTTTKVISKFVSKP